MAISVFALMMLFPDHFASADPVSITWDFLHHSISDSGVVSFVPFVKFTVTDTSLENNDKNDIISVKVNSTSDPTGIILNLPEIADTGTFVNHNLIFAVGPPQFKISDGEKITVIDPSLNLDPNNIETIPSIPGGDGMFVFSTTDQNGITLPLTETGPDTGVFTNILHFTKGPSVDGRTIQVNNGDVFTLFYSFTGDMFSALIIPNPDPAVGVISLKNGDTIDAIYKGVKMSTIVDASGAGGGGSGGILPVGPHIVLDLILTPNIIGGAPYIVSPPSFGGGYYPYSDGLTLTLGGTDTKTFDASKYNQELPKQVMVAGMPVNMTFKTFEAYNKNGVIHMGLYIIPRGQDMITSNSLASIVWEKGKDVEIIDPNHILSDTSASSTTSDKFQYTQFLFTPTKSYDKMSFLVKAWNDHLYPTDIRMHDAIETPDQLVSLPDGVISYDNFNNLSEAIEKDGYAKPPILSHIHDTSSVFNSVPGKVYWLYDTRDHTVTRVLENDKGKVIDMKVESLVSQPIQPTQNFLLGNTFYSHHSLSRNNVDELAETKSIEELKALNLMTELYGKDYVVQYNFLGKQ